MLVKDGVFVVNGENEGFNTSTEIWRATRQVGLGIANDGWYVVAILERGTPEEFARALIAANLRQALRLDSGSSVTVLAAGSPLGGRVGRKVPNAVVFTAR
jgi:hypothetical protein